MGQKFYDLDNEQLCDLICGDPEPLDFEMKKGDKEMTKQEYLEKILKDYDDGKISAEAYDRAIENIDEFCEED